MAILISIKPEYVCKILNREKTLEVRTTCPADWKKYLDGKTNIKPKPCKVYIYCTKGKDLWMHNKETIILGDTNLTSYWLNGKVVAEFALKEVEKIEQYIAHSIPTCIYITDTKRTASMLEDATCLTQDEIHNYLKSKTGYAWHIDNLIIYDKPKELSEFQKDLDCDDYPCNKGKYCEYDYYDYCEGCEACGIDFDGSHCIYKQLKKPPQSWCYVE